MGQESSQQFIYRNAWGYRPQVINQYMCSTYAEDIVEYAMDEVDDAYSPHESEEGTKSHKIL